MTCEIPLAPECTQDYIYDCGGHGYCVVDGGQRKYLLYFTVEVCEHVRYNLNCNVMLIMLV